MNKYILEYIKEFGIKEFDKEKQLELLSKYRNENDLDVRNELLESMYLLIIKYINKLKEKNKEIDVEEMFQQGVYFVIKSFDSYKFESGIKPSTYAQIYLYRLTENIRIGVKNDTGSNIKFARSFREEMNKIYKFIVEFEEVNGEPPSEEIIAKKFDMTIEELREMLDLNNVSDIDNIVYEDGEELGIFEVIEDNKVNIEEQVISEIMKEEVKNDTYEIFEKIKSILTKRELEVLNVLIEKGGEKITQEEIAEILNITKQRVSQLLEKVREKIIPFISPDYQKKMNDLLRRMNRTERGIIIHYEKNTFLNHRTLAKNFRVDVKDLKEFIDFYESKKKEFIKEEKYMLEGMISLAS